jgi:hypothetical protein
MRIRLLGSIMLGLAIAGCSEADVDVPEGSVATPVSSAPPPPTPPAPGTVPPPNGPPVVPSEMVKADVGVGKKGRGYGGGIITAPVKARFTAEQNLVFNAQIPHALNLFQATNGRFPKDHDEFMKEIITANAIKLPELPEPDKYIYDPATHELMVQQFEGNENEPK